MLHCSACIRNSIPTVFSDVCNPPVILTSSPRLFLTKPGIRHSAWVRQGYATGTSLARDVSDRAPPLLPQYRTHPSKVEPYKKSNLKLEVRWLKDPVSLAEHTVKLLREDDFQKALEIVRLASKDVECTVSWNHLIDYEMSKARVSNAVKLYNEMKKRAQLPDAYTFTIIFRGLSWYPHFSQSSARALSIYQSMFAENSPVRPSIIHTNAVLKVCALAHDVDALLGIAAELPIRGSGAPDNLTFTIILNAIRSKAFGETSPRTATSREEDTERNETTALAIQQGRRLWLEVRRRWMSGDLRLDEEFVCAMGRLLLLGNKAQDHDDILSLLEQTMDVPRQVARLADVAPRRAEEALGPDDDLELSPHVPANIKPETLLPAPKEEDELPDPPSDPFAPPASAAGPKQSAVRPGRNNPLPRTRRLYPSQIFIPDGENYHTYLRLLRLQRSSKLALELVDEMRSGILTGRTGSLQIKTFRIALSCCVRDINNKNSIIHAGKLVRMMMDTLPYPDAKALSMYLQVALGQKPRDWRVIMGVIRGTELGVRNLRSLLAYDPAGPQKQNEEDILELVKELIGAFDIVLDLGNEEIKDEEKRRCREQRFTLAAYVTRMHTRYRQLVVEGYKDDAGKEEDKGLGRKLTIRKSRSGRSRDHHHRSENDRSEGERDEAVARISPRNVSRVGPVRGEWKRGWKIRGRDGAEGGKDDSETKDRVGGWRFRGGRFQQPAEGYKAV